MKLFLSIIFIILPKLSLFAQQDTIYLKKKISETRKIVTDRTPQAVYFQFGGSGPILSVNYDTRFRKKVNGAGFTAGLGFFGGSGDAIVSVPVSVNYLFGRKSDFAEIAGGATFIAGSTSNIFSENSNSSTFFYHLNAGYRHQSATKGFFFRGGVSPLFLGSGEFVTWFYLGAGYNF
ncbi:hypothetical protein [Mucilaginibacter arboris]|uniref:Outer membrane protein beta-barrel domain-containing protein n=1 Tax=Mucilaginibacter arboris TaxID=2682090 RepID=A0A7K1SZ25_9SPHI|nr:hypothetical protein [Mucilaginibacter arboris]MVN22565.1 hypothetical protein [Mucilaginibacter arboris]